MKTTVALILLVVLSCVTPPALSGERLCEALKEHSVAAKSDKPTKSDKKIKLKKSEVERKSDLKDNVKRKEGNVWISNVPMVDQGDKPICSIAVMQRLLCYFTGEKDGDSPIARKTLKKALGYQSGEGTDLRVMTETLQRNAKSLHLTCDPFYSVDMSLEQIVEEYNKIAEKKKGAKRVSMKTKKGTATQMKEIVKGIDYGCWKKLRKEKLGSGRSDCWKKIVSNIDRGIPIVWTVEFGLYSEFGSKQVKGAHMRLIIGYNEKHRQVIYSDTWGEAHAYKTMDWEDAWAITFNMMRLYPMKK